MMSYGWIFILGVHNFIKWWIYPSLHQLNNDLPTKFFNPEALRAFPADGLIKAFGLLELLQRYRP